MPINWEITDYDFALIVRIAERAKRDLTGYPDSKRTLILDLHACHCNGCPLYLEGLLNANLQDFSHDICGIRDAINRETGKLTEDVFMPRYALPNFCHCQRFEEGGGSLDSLCPVHRMGHKSFQTTFS